MPNQFPTSPFTFLQNSFRQPTANPQSSPQISGGLMNMFQRQPQQSNSLARMSEGRPFNQTTYNLLRDMYQTNTGQGYDAWHSPKMDPNSSEYDPEYNPSTAESGGPDTWKKYDPNSSEYDPNLNPYDPRSTNYDRNLNSSDVYNPLSSSYDRSADIYGPTGPLGPNSNAYGSQGPNSLANRIASHEEAMNSRGNQRRNMGYGTAAATAINPFMGAAMRSQTPRYQGTENNANIQAIERQRMANRPQQQRPQMNQGLLQQLFQNFMRNRNRA